VLAEGHQHDAPRREDGAHAHGDGRAGYRFLVWEILERVLARDAIEMDEARVAAPGGAGFIEADVAGAADTEQLEIDSAGAGDELLVLRAGGGGIRARDGAVGEMRALRVEIDMVEQVLAHEVVVALRLVGRDRVILVEIERDDIREAQALFLMEPHQFLVDVNRRGTGREAEHGEAAFVFALANQCRDLGGDLARGGLGLAVNHERDPLPARRLQRKGKRLGVGDVAHDRVSIRWLARPVSRQRNLRAK